MSNWKAVVDFQCRTENVGLFLYLPANNVFHKIKKVEQFGESVLVTCLQMS